MEEVQPIGVLDREILEDARKKAARILRSADEQIAASALERDREIDRAVEEIRQRHGKRLEQGRGEILARLPLDTRRARLEKMDGLLRGAGRDYLAGLGREQLLSLVERGFADRARNFSGASAGAGAAPRSGEAYRVSCRNMDARFLEGMMGKYLPGSSWTFEEAPPAEEAEEAGVSGTGEFPALVLDNGAVRISVSAWGILESLLEERRGELASALLGEEALDA